MTLPVQVRYYCDLVLVLLHKELRVRYKSTVLGYAWSVLHPLAFAGVFFVLFKVILKVPIENYALFLICGQFPWQWFQNSVSSANAAFVGNGSLIKKVRFPRELLVLSGVLNDLVHFLASIPVIVIFMFCYHCYPSVSWLYQVPLLLVVQLLLTYGLALLVATCNLFFRDLERLTVIFLMLWFYVTPVLYEPGMVPGKIRWLMEFNPMAAIVTCWREIFLSGHLPLKPLALAAAFAGLSFMVGRAFYRSLQGRFAEIV